MSLVHTITYCVMAVSFLTLGSHYLQLRDRFDDLFTSCQTIASKENDNQLFLPKTFVHLYVQSSSMGEVSSPLLSGSENNWSHSGTKEAFLSIDSMSVSFSDFESSQTAMEATMKLIILPTTTNLDMVTTEMYGSDKLKTSDITSTPTLNHMIITSEVSFNKEIHISSVHSVRPQGSMTSAVNNWMLKSKTTGHLERNQYSYRHPENSFDDHETATSLSLTTDLTLHPTSFKSNPMSVLETKETVVQSSYSKSSIDLFITKDQPTSMTQSDQQDSDIPMFTTMHHENKNVCFSQNCDDVINNSINEITDPIDQINEDKKDFTTSSQFLNIKRESNVYSEYDHSSHADDKLIHQTFHSELLDSLMSQGTSINCKESDSQGKICHFSNLCFKTKEKDFIFVKGDKIIVESEPARNVSNLLTVDLSSVHGHSAHIKSLVPIPAEALSKFSVAVVDKTSFIMSRFKPDNIMHVLHDDILPLHNTLHDLHLLHSNRKPDLALVFTDNFDFGDFINLYTSFSVSHPILLNRLNTSVDIICFAKSFVGLSSSTLWYQYGFFKPQGPLQINGVSVIHKVSRAVNYLSDSFKQSCVFCQNKNYLVFISRKDNRRILNEVELVMALARSTKLKVMSVSLELQSLSEIIPIIRNSNGIIGMHGSLLSLLIFLQPETVVIELFPYGVVPSKYAPFKTFTELPGTGIVYKSWANPHQDKSMGHPDWVPELGGIQHLPPLEQERIIQETEVQDHLCCSDPSWLYHIYQDTEVDVPAVISLTLMALNQAKSLKLKIHSPEMFIFTPGPVKNVTCSNLMSNDRPGFQVSWTLPWNLELISHTFLQSQIVYQRRGEDESHHVSLSSTIFSFIIDIPEYFEYDVWVRVVIDHNITGPYSYIVCHS